MDPSCEYSSLSLHHQKDHVELTTVVSSYSTCYVYEDADYEQTCELIDTTTEYALTGAIFSNDRAALIKASSKLRNA